MTYDIKIQFKTFEVELGSFHAWLQSNAGNHYAGMSANSSIQLHFTSEPSDQIKDTITTYWNGLSESSENTRIAAAAKLLRAEQAARESISYQTWDQMLPAERKIVAGQAINDSDRESLLTKYPQL